MRSWLPRTLPPWLERLRGVINYPLYVFWHGKRIRILMYHRVCDLPAHGKIQYWNVHPESFAEQMDFLFRRGFSTITLDEFIDCKEKNRKPPPKSIIITFDDGYADNYINAMPILEKYGFRATFLIVTDYIGGQEPFQWPGLEWDEPSLSHYQKNRESWLPLNEAMLLDMNKRGASFGSHTMTHCALNQVEKDEAIRQLEDSKKRLEGILSTPVRCFSYPFGEITEEIKGLVKAAGYRAAACSKFGGNSLESDFFELRRIVIEEQDSIYRFKNKIEGAYDWYGYCQRFVQCLRQVFLREHVK